MTPTPLVLNSPSNSPFEKKGRAKASARWLGALGGAAAIAVGARFDLDLPGTPVPQSAQTLAVVLAGALLGRVWGPVGVGLYLAAGALGLPVFADGKSGAGVLVGPTAGYLAGFVAGAWISAMSVGRVGHRRIGRGFAMSLAGMLVAHAVILLLGWARLAMTIGGVRAWEVGVAPFLVGGLIKSLAGAVVWLGWVWWRRQRSVRDPNGVRSQSPG